MRRSLIALTLALAIGLSAATPAYAALTVSDMSKELMCQCGCTMVVEPCDCETANQMRDIIGGMIDKGQTKKQIIDYFVGQYGESILAAPTKKGFNLTVWVLPFVAIAAGGVALYFILRTWVWKGKSPPEPSLVEPQSDEVTDKYRRRFQEEFNSYLKEDNAP